MAGMEHDGDDNGLHLERILAYTGMFVFFNTEWINLRFVNFIAYTYMCVYILYQKKKIHKNIEL